MNSVILLLFFLSHNKIKCHILTTTRDALNIEIRLNITPYGRMIIISLYIKISPKLINLCCLINQNSINKG